MKYRYFVYKRYQHAPSTAPGFVARAEDARFFYFYRGEVVFEFRGRPRRMVEVKEEGHKAALRSVIARYGDWCVPEESPLT